MHEGRTVKGSFISPTPSSSCWMRTIAWKRPGCRVGTIAARSRPSSTPTVCSWKMAISGDRHHRVGDHPSRYALRRGPYSPVGRRAVRFHRLPVVEHSIISDSIINEGARSTMPSCSVPSSASTPCQGGYKRLNVGILRPCRASNISFPPPCQFSPTGTILPSCFSCHEG